MNLYVLFISAVHNGSVFCSTTSTGVFESKEAAEKFCNDESFSCYPIENGFSYHQHGAELVENESIMDGHKVTVTIEKLP